MNVDAQLLMQTKAQAATLEVILARLIADALREALMRRTHVEHSRAVWSGRAYWGPDAQPLSPAAGNPIGEPFVH